MLFFRKQFKRDSWERRPGCVLDHRNCLHECVCVCVCVFLLRSAARKYVKTRYRFLARNANELSVMEDEVLEVRMGLGRREGGRERERERERERKREKGKEGERERERMITLNLGRILTFGYGVKQPCM